MTFKIASDIFFFTFFFMTGLSFEWMLILSIDLEKL